MLGKGENGTGWAVEFMDGIRLERKTTEHWNKMRVVIGLVGR